MTVNSLLRRYKKSAIFLVFTVLVAVVGFLNSSLGFLDKLWEMLSSSDLVVSPLDQESRILALDGYPVLTDRTDKRPVFTGGFKVLLTLSHNRKGHESVIVTRVIPIIADFEPGANANYRYSVDGSQIKAKGIAPPKKFLLPLYGKKIGTTTWSYEDPATKTVLAREASSDDILNTDPPMHLKLSDSPDNDTEELIGHIVAKEAGLYRIFFRIEYTCDGKDRVHVTDSVLLYSE